jgi:hypothetical protein
VVNRNEAVLLTVQFRITARTTFATAAADDQRLGGEHGVVALLKRRNRWCAMESLARGLKKGDRGAGPSAGRHHASYLGSWQRVPGKKSSQHDTASQPGVRRSEQFTRLLRLALGGAPRSSAP